MRRVDFGIRSGRFAVKDVIGADRNENRSVIARVPRDGAYRESIDCKRWLGFVFATIDVRKRGRVYQYVGSNSLDCVAHLRALSDVHLCA